MKFIFVIDSANRPVSKKLTELGARSRLISYFVLRGSKGSRIREYIEKGSLMVNRSVSQKSKGTKHEDGPPTTGRTFKKIKARGVSKRTSRGTDISLV